MKKRIISLLLTAGLSAALLAGCGDSGKAAQTTEAASEASAQTQKTTESGTAADSTSAEAETVTTQTTETVTTQTTEAAMTEGTSTESQNAGSESTGEQENQKDAFGSIDPDTVYKRPDGVESTYYGKDALMQIVVIGDSQFANYLGSDGIPYMLSRACHANVFNLAIGGTCATVGANETTNDSEWTSPNGVGMARAIEGKVDADKILSNYDYTRNVFHSCNFAKTTVFIVEYGVNDYLSSMPMNSSDNRGRSPKGFRGALSDIISSLHDTDKDAKIILVSPVYAQFYDSKGAYVGDGNIYKNSLGLVLRDYVDSENNVASDYGSYLQYMDAYYGLNIDSSNAYEQLEADGIHMTSKGRDRYVQLLGRLCIRAAGYSIDPDTDPRKVEWWKTK